MSSVPIVPHLHPDPPGVLRRKMERLAADLLADMAEFQAHRAMLPLRLAFILSS